MKKKLRISHIIVQPVLVYDDGEELTPGPDIQAISVPLSRLTELADSLPGEVEALSNRDEAQD